MKKRLIIWITAAGMLGLASAAAMPKPAAAHVNIPLTNKVDNRGAARSSTPFPIREILPQIKGKTQVPIFLPSSLPFSDKLYFKNEVTKNSYSVEFNRTANCRATPCYMGAIQAEKGRQLTQPTEGVTQAFKNLQLARGVKGIFHNGCGAYCTALVEWQSQGVLYRVTMKNGREGDLTQIANSAIQAGRR